jgi:hypothetical protein
MAVVVGDALSTVAIFVGVLIGSVLAVIWFYGAPTLDERQELITILADTIYFAFSFPHLEDSEGGIERMLFLAPLLTSAWLWVYLVVAYGMRLASHLPSWLRPLSKVMDFEHHPVRTIGYVAATVSAAIVGAMTFV